MIVEIVYMIVNIVIATILALMVIIASFGAAMMTVERWEKWKEEQNKGGGDT